MPASSKGSSVGKVILAGLAVVSVSVVAGYQLGGLRTDPSANKHVVTHPTTLPTAPPPAKPKSTRTAKIDPNRDYAAPGAPRITIEEDKDEKEKTPPPPAEGSRVIRPDADAEISEDAATPKADTATAVDPDKKSDQTPDTSEATPPSDTDYEKVTPAPDAEAGEEGQALYRVQAGAFRDPKAAHRLAQALRDRGYSATTRQDQDGDTTFFKVQTGSYRNRSAAQKAVEDLRRIGYPASISISGL